MKYIFTTIFLLGYLTSLAYSWSPHNLQSAHFIAGKGIINDNSLSPSKYNLDYKITRREMLKVMMNLSGKSVPESCNSSFSDMNSNDWGCKYGQAALRE